MPYSALPNPAYPQTNIISSDTTIYVGTTGSDGYDGLTPSTPFATFSKAWQTAQTYTIVGDSTLYIQFQKGIYNISNHDAFFPSDLNHPQGANIIIQGDPTAIKERYLWKVGSYNWDLAPMSFYGHTGEVNLWSSSSGLTHGFTGEDIGGYVSIVNHTLSKGSYRVSNNGDGVSDSKWSGDYVLRHAFNHGYPYEESDGILGLAKIVSATADGQTLGLAFRNINADSRVIGYFGTDHGSGKVGGGLRNTIPWCGISNNYPESQYSEPIGYYGNAGWSAGAGTTAFPAQPSGLTYISDDVFSVINFPVVFRVSGNASRQSIRMITSGSRIKAIRNLMFARAEYDGDTYGAQPLVNGLARNYNTLQPSGPVSAFYMLGNVETSIRHIGVLGYYNALQLQKGAKIYDYSPSSTIDSSWNYLRRTPVLMASHIRSDAIQAYDNSLVQFGVFDSSSLEYSCNTWIQAYQRAIAIASGSVVRLEDLYSSTVIGQLPNFRISLNIPIFAGSTVGSTAGFYNSWSTSTYKNATLLVNGTKIGRVVYVVPGPTLTAWTNLNATWSGGMSAGQNGPVYTQRVDFYGYKLENYTLCNRDSWLAGAAADDKCEIRAYSNSNETGFVSGITVGKNIIYLQGFNGATIAGTTTSGGGLSFGISGPNQDGGYYNANKSSYSNIQLLNDSVFTVRNAIIDGGYVPLCTNYTTDTITVDESISVKSYNHTALYAARGKINISPYAVVAVKNPGFGYPFSGVDNNATSYPYFGGCAVAIRSEALGAVNMGGINTVVAIGWPQSVASAHGGADGKAYGLRATGTGVNVRSRQDLNCLFAARYNSTINSYGVYGSYCYADDGGVYSDALYTGADAGFIFAAYGGKITGVMGVGQPAFTGSQTVPYESTSDTSRFSHAGDSKTYITSILTGISAGITQSGAIHEKLATRRTWQPNTTSYSALQPLYNVRSDDVSHYEWWKGFENKIGRLGRAAPSNSPSTSGGGSLYTRVPAMRSAPTGQADAGTFITGVTMAAGYTWGAPMGTVTNNGLIIPQGY
jgi:hypothetical protein